MLKKLIKPLFLAVMLAAVLYQSLSLYGQYTRKQELAQQLVAAEQQEQRLKAEQEQAHARALAQWEQARKARERVLKQRRVYAIESEGTNSSTVKQVIEEPPPLPPPPPPPPTVIEASLSQGIRVELQNDTSWQTILQLVFTVLATYLGLKLINKYVSTPKTA
jgi:hypothetical protein